MKLVYLCQAIEGMKAHRTNLWPRVDYAVEARVATHYDPTNHAEK